MLVFQPAEELGAGAKAMVEDGLFNRFGRPDVVLGQHVGPLAAGLLGIHAGLVSSASDSLTITLHGRGVHGSRPEKFCRPGGHGRSHRHAAPNDRVARDKLAPRLLS